MRYARTIIPLAVMLALGADLACKKPEPAPKVDEDAAKRAAEEEARRKAEEEARRKAEEEARMRSEEEARRKAEEEARRAASEKEAAFRRAAEAALKEINFDFDKSNIREEDKAKLQVIAEFLKANPQVRLKVEGHCDERGTVEYNLALGDRRANAAMRYLVGLGVAESRLETISFGKERPKATGSTETSWFVNRRCEFKMI